MRTCFLGRKDVGLAERWRLKGFLMRLRGDGGGLCFSLIMIGMSIASGFGLRYGVMKGRIEMVRIDENLYLFVERGTSGVEPDVGLGVDTSAKLPIFSSPL
jgi:hypothetical protein